MNLIADLHIHSYLSRACSKELKPESLYQWCQRKGVAVLATGDFTHPQWMAELKEKLEPAEEGLFTLNKDLAAKADKEIPPSCRSAMRFLLSVEISCIYKKNGRVRKVHHLVFCESFEAAQKINARLEKIGNIRSDGRPILGLDSKLLLEIVLEASPQAHLIPAHAWTPHFAIFGSESGFDSLEECFDDLTPYIFAIETGLSSDPPMNWRLSGLDNITLISNSDAHSLEKLAREANVLETELSYQGIFSALKRQGPGRTLKTLEFFPEEGKYHVDGHRNCKVRLEPEETLRRQGLCPVCGKPVTVGVLHRVNKLADRPKSQRPPKAAGFEYLIPLKELIAQVQRVGPQSVKVDREYHRLINLFGSELFILRELPLGQIERESGLLGLAISRMRREEVTPEPGYDGEYGIIKVLKPDDFKVNQELMLL
ncbi:MAG: DNA helicase UvrD [Elusimicrobia bacterium]|nr:DNA helicase UvrD [Elusimicrobiota bacterium]